MDIVIGDYQDVVFNLLLQMNIKSLLEFVKTSNNPNITAIYNDNNFWMTKTEEDYGLSYDKLSNKSDFNWKYIYYLLVEAEENTDDEDDFEQTRKNDAVNLVFYNGLINQDIQVCQAVINHPAITLSYISFLEVTINDNLLKSLKFLLMVKDSDYYSSNVKAEIDNMFTYLGNNIAVYITENNDKFRFETIEVLMNDNRFNLENVISKEIFIDFVINLFTNRRNIKPIILVEKEKLFVTFLKFNNFINYLNDIVDQILVKLIESPSDVNLIELLIKNADLSMNILLKCFGLLVDELPIPLIQNKGNILLYKYINLYNSTFKLLKYMVHFSSHDLLEKTLDKNPLNNKNMMKLFGYLGKIYNELIDNNTYGEFYDIYMKQYEQTFKIIYNHGKKILIIEDLKILLRRFIYSSEIIKYILSESINDNLVDYELVKFYIEKSMFASRVENLLYYKNYNIPKHGAELLEYVLNNKKKYNYQNEMIKVLLKDPRINLTMLNQTSKEKILEIVENLNFKTEFFKNRRNDPFKLYPIKFSMSLSEDDV